MARPRRLDGISYNGPSMYFVTTCTKNRANAFRDIDFGREAAAVLLATASRQGFAVPAYCLMPDHAHVLLTAQAGRSSLRDTIRRWKQASGYRWHLRHGQRLWQEGYFERVLRSDDAELTVARYVIENPVRAGLVTSATEYPLSGSSLYTVAGILEAAQMDGRRPRWR